MVLPNELDLVIASLYNVSADLWNENNWHVGENLNANNYALK